MAGRRGRQGVVGDVLLLDRTVGVDVAQLIYWVGLGLIALLAFAVVGAAVGILIRSGFPEGLLLGLPLLVAGLMLVAVAGLLWRGACEFFLAVFQIADDLAALRRAQAPAAPPAAPARY